MPPKRKNITTAQEDVALAAENAAPAPRRYKAIINYVGDERSSEQWVVWLNEATARFIEDNESPMDRAEHLLNMLYWCTQNNFVKAKEIVDLYDGNESSDIDRFGEDSQSETWKEYYQPELLPEARAWLDTNNLVPHIGVLWYTSAISEGPFDLVYTWRSYTTRE